MSNKDYFIIFIGLASICGLITKLWFAAGYKVGKMFRKSKCTNHLFEVDEIINLFVDPTCTKCGEKYSKIMQQKSLVELIATEVENAKYANHNCIATAERILKIVKSHETTEIHK